MWTATPATWPTRRRCVRLAARIEARRLSCRRLQGRRARVAMVAQKADVGRGGFGALGCPGRARRPTSGLPGARVGLAPAPRRRSVGSGPLAPLRRCCSRPLALGLGLDAVFPDLGQPALIFGLVCRHLGVALGEVFRGLVLGKVLLAPRVIFGVSALPSVLWDRAPRHQPRVGDVRTHLTSQSQPGAGVR